MTRNMTGVGEALSHDMESRCRIQGVHELSSDGAPAWQMMTRLQCRWSWMGRKRKSFSKMSTPWDAPQHKSSKCQAQACIEAWQSSLIYGGSCLIA